MQAAQMVCHLVWALSLFYLLFAIETVETHVISEKSTRNPLLVCNDLPSRRTLLDQSCRAILGGHVLLGLPLSGNAEDDTPGAPTGGKPYAPLEALLPAMRCKIWIDRAYSLSSKLSSVNDKEADYKILEELNAVLSNRPALFLKNERPVPRLRSSAAAQITASVSSVNKEQYRKNRESLSLPNQLAAMLNQADVERQWGMLQYAESRQEQENPIRAAFNYYTQQLEYGDSYLLTASKEDKKRMIRNDQLPSLAAVITSDLDLRDLYRNQLLTAVDDAEAEVAYQIKQTVGDIDLSDVVALMNQAHSACDSWFGLIAQEDIQEAFDAIARDK